MSFVSTAFRMVKATAGNSSSLSGPPWAVLQRASVGASTSDVQGSCHWPATMTGPRAPFEAASIGMRATGIACEAGRGSLQAGERGRKGESPNGNGVVDSAEFSVIGERAEGEPGRGAVGELGIRATGQAAASGIAGRLGRVGRLGAGRDREEKEGNAGRGPSGRSGHRAPESKEGEHRP